MMSEHVCFIGQAVVRGPEVQKYSTLIGPCLAYSSYQFPLLWLELVPHRKTLSSLLAQRRQAFQEGRCGCRAEECRPCVPVHLRLVYKHLQNLLNLLSLDNTFALSACTLCAFAVSCCSGQDVFSVKCLQQPALGFCSLHPPLPPHRVLHVFSCSHIGVPSVSVPPPAPPPAPRQAFKRILF